MAETGVTGYRETTGMYIRLRPKYDKHYWTDMVSRLRQNFDTQLYEILPGWFIIYEIRMYPAVLYATPHFLSLMAEMP